MPYKQGRNPISRKNSPLNARNPFSRVSPLSMKAEDGTPHRKMDDETKAKHKAEMHSKGRDPEQDEALREEDMGQEANQPTGPERRASKSPLNKHDEWQAKIDAARKAYIKKHGDESGFYEVHADLFKKQEEARKAHKDEGPSRKSSSPVKAKCPEGWTLNPDPKGKPCLPPKKERKDEVGPRKEKTAPSRKSSSPLKTDPPKPRPKAENVSELEEEKVVESKVEKAKEIKTSPKAKFKKKSAKDADKVDSSGRTGSKKDERKKRRKERKAIRKDKTLSRSQKAMAKKESRDKQKENIKNK